MWKYCWRGFIRINGHIIGLCLQSEKLEPSYKTPSSTVFRSEKVKILFCCYCLYNHPQGESFDRYELGPSRIQHTRKETELETLGQLIVPFRYSWFLTPRNTSALTQLLQQFSRHPELSTDFLQKSSLGSVLKKGGTKLKNNDNLERWRIAFCIQ